MPQYHHPNAVRDTVDDVDDAVDIDGDIVPVDADGTLDLTERQAEKLAGWYDLDADALRVADGETCDAVKQDGEVCGRELPCPYHSDAEG